MDYQATAKYLRIGPRKVLLVASTIKKLAPEAALVYLAQLPKAATRPLAQVVTSALANARHKQANLNSLRFKTIEVMVGPVMKRWRAVSRGTAHAYKKRMTHVRVVLTDD